MSPEGAFPRCLARRQHRLFPSRWLALTAAGCLGTPGASLRGSFRPQKGPSRYSSFWVCCPICGSVSISQVTFPSSPRLFSSFNEKMIPLQIALRFPEQRQQCTLWRGALAPSSCLLAPPGQLCVVVVGAALGTWGTLNLGVPPLCSSPTSEEARGQAEALPRPWGSQKAVFIPLTLHKLLVMEGT